MLEERDWLNGCKAELTVKGANKNSLYYEEK